VKAVVLTTIEPRQPEAALVRAAQDGDRAAFGALYQQFGRLVHGVLLAHVPYHDAEDLMQDVFIKALEQLGALREPGAFPGWLVAIARRTATDFLRGRRITTEAGPFLAGGRAPDGEAFAVLAVIRRLPESYRETLILRLVEGMTGPEIAARTGLTPDSVRVNLCRGMKLLRDQLEGHGKA
jgi:RNA polymerase sigma-70 factor, ECF subfamily